MSRPDDQIVRDVLAHLEPLIGQIGTDYTRARKGALELLDGIGYPTTTPGSPDRTGPTGKGQHSDPTSHAATSTERTRAERIHADLADRLHTLDRAATALTTALDVATAAGLTGRPAVICRWCGRQPTGLNGDYLEDGICIRHRCIDCNRIPSGEPGDRLKKGRCRSDYMAHWRKQQAEAEGDAA